MQALFLLALVQRFVWGNHEGPIANQPSIPATFATVGIAAVLTILGIVSGIAAWNVYRQGRSVRIWGITGSVVTLLLFLPLLYLVLRDDESGFLANTVFGFLTIGTIGVSLFCLRMQFESRSDEGKKTESIRGDGTNGVFNKMVWLVGVAIGLASMEWWEHWSRIESLSDRIGHLQWFLPVILIAVLIHEAGHAIAALSVGMKISSVGLGPFYWWIQDGRWMFTLSLKRVLSIGGAIGVASRRGDEPQWFRVWVAAAGPTANLLVGTTAFGLAITSKGSSYEDYWRILADIATINIATFILNLVPLRVGGFYSDGAKISQMLSGGVWADHLKVCEQSASTKITGIRPRDYDLPCVERLAAKTETPSLSLICRIIALQCLLDRSDNDRAVDAFEQADLASQRMGADISAEICAEMAYASAFLKQDPSAARKWWHQMESLGADPSREDQLLAFATLNWIEGHTDIARECWRLGNEIVQKLPDTGSSNFCRQRYHLLQEAMGRQLVLP